MHISPAAFILIFAVWGGAAYGQAPPPATQPPAGAARPQTMPAQQPSSGAARAQATTAQPQGGAPAPVNPPSSLIKPSLISVEDMLNNLRLDRWKKGSVRDEASDHVSSLLKDMQSNLPPLLSAADAAPASVSQAIPLVKHLDAFYDVLLRVEEAARVSAPAEQISALQHSMLQLNQARLALDDHLQAQSAAQEKQVVDLQSSLKVQQQAVAQAKAAAAPTPPQPCKPPASPANKKPATKKPAATTTTPSTTPSATTPAKPSPAQPQSSSQPKPK